MEGLRARQQETEDDDLPGRVSAPLPAAYTAAWFRPHSLLRVPGRTTPLAYMLQLARQLLEGSSAETAPPSMPARVLFHCPVGDGPMMVVERLTGARLRHLARIHQDALTDSS